MPTHTDSVRFTDIALALRDYADNPSAYLALNEGNAFFCAPDIPGVVVYRETGRYWIQFGGPFAAPENRGALLRAFLIALLDSVAQWSRLRCSAPTRSCTRRTDSLVNPTLGALTGHSRPLSSITSHGSSFRAAAIRPARNEDIASTASGVQIAEVDAGGLLCDIQTIDAAWLHGKGRHVKQLEFLVGGIGGEAQRSRRMFTGSIAGTTSRVRVVCTRVRNTTPVAARSEPTDTRCTPRGDGSDQHARHRDVSR